ncbi:RagB/SusD domain-containing protein [Cyclobacterium marinum DSM 745]|uniref:RagB/SusD domain-containing protein n=2 Tax=Cyclobacterium marinum TaxID=104 RepID=G0J473_CYCMS|nr:RagB/SusD domain-containing protein [Cyclobacterium marinum DSM 745]
MISMVVFSSTLLYSCEDYLVKYPLDQPSDATFWSTESELQMAINSVYRSLYFTDRATTHVPFQFLFDFATDISWDRNLSVWQLLGQGQVTSVEPTLIFGAWSNAYVNIGNCNRLLAYMHKAENVTNADTFKRIEAEARFFRAYWYGWLINLYGDVPFTTDPLDVFDAGLPQTDKETIYHFVMEELELAGDMLPEEYPSSDRGRITKGAAWALKARLALFNNDWEIAAEASGKVMALGKYELYSNFDELFTYEGQNNSEELLTIQFSRANQLTHETPIHTRGRLTGGFATKIPTQALIDSYASIDGLSINESPLYDPKNPFENRDPRLNATCVVPGSIFLGYQFETHPDSLQVWDYNQNPPKRIDNQEVINPYATFSGYQYRKYVSSDEREFRRESELNIMLIRYAEILLIYAESHIELGQVDNTVYEAINSVRERAGIPGIEQGKSLEELRQIVRQERKVEFAYEGLRFFDIRRWEIAEDVLSGPLYGRPLGEYKSNHIPEFDENGTPVYEAYAGELRVFDTRIYNPSKDKLLPIPQRELDINSNLTQNPGY